MTLLIILFSALAVTNFAMAYGLYKMKKWSLYPTGAFAVILLLLTVLSKRPESLIFIFLIGVLFYFLYSNRDKFN